MRIYDKISCRWFDTYEPLVEQAIMEIHAGTTVNDFYRKVGLAPIFGIGDAKLVAVTLTMMDTCYEMKMEYSLDES